MAEKIIGQLDAVATAALSGDSSCANSQPTLSTPITQTVTTVQSLQSTSAPSSSRTVHTPICSPSMTTLCSTTSYANSNSVHLPQEEPGSAFYNWSQNDQTRPGSWQSSYEWPDYSPSSASAFLATSFDRTGQQQNHPCHCLSNVRDLENRVAALEETIKTLQQKKSDVELPSHGKCALSYCIKLFYY